jgi:hypothetical protein
MGFLVFRSRLPLKDSDARNGFEATMISVGYMAKRVAVRPEWLKAERVKDIYSVSGCVSKNFADFINYWKHNGYWFFNSPQVLLELAQQNSIDVTGAILFFYEAYEQEFDDTEGQWAIFQPEPSFKTQVVPPTEMALEGYDIVTFSLGTSAECSPLSCNSLAAQVQTNEHCLLPSLKSVLQLLEADKFNDMEPGPYRVFAVYSTEWS